MDESGFAIEMKREERSTAGGGNARGRLRIGLLAVIFLAGLIGCRPEVEKPSLLIFLTVDTLRSDRLKRSLDREVPETRQQLTDADRETLRALGYAEEPSDSGDETR